MSGLTVPKTAITAYEVKRELRKYLERRKNGSTPRFAVLEELRLGTGLSRSGAGRNDIKKHLSRLQGLKRRGESTIGEIHPRSIDDEIERFERMLNDPERDRRESRIDLFAIDCWPGRDARHERRAYEIKVDRSDLLSEFADPGKRAPWVELVNAFYLVVPKGLTTASEVAERAPECGLLYYSPKLKPTIDQCDCSYDGPRPAAEWCHDRDCTFREMSRTFLHGRTFDTARPPMKLDGGEPSWGTVASIIRSVSRSAA